MRICITTCIRSCGCCCDHARQQQSQQGECGGARQVCSGGGACGTSYEEGDSRGEGRQCYSEHGQCDGSRGGRGVGCGTSYEEGDSRGEGRQCYSEHGQCDGSRGGRGVGCSDDSDDEWRGSDDERDGGSNTYPTRDIDEVDRPRSLDKKRIRDSAQNLKGYNPHWGPSHRDGRVRALLIGINYYGSKSELSGCVNDVRHELTALKAIKFPADEVAILVDDDSFPHVTARPTRENMLKYMAWLVDDAQEGDVLFMHYSGHGTQTRSSDKHEKKSQVICPVDYESAGVIVDDDLYDILAADLPAGVRLTVVLDSCNSGTALDLPYKYAAGADDSKSGARMKRVRDDHDSRGDVIMFSGASDTQTSASVKNTSKIVKTGSGGKSTGGPGGAATQCFTYILRHMHDLSYKDAVMRARELLSKQNLDQSPQLTSSRPIDLNARFSLTDRLRSDK